MSPASFFLFFFPLLWWTRRCLQLLNKHPLLCCLSSTNRWWCNLRTTLQSIVYIVCRSQQSNNQLGCLMPLSFFLSFFCPSIMYKEISSVTKQATCSLFLILYQQIIIHFPTTLQSNVYIVCRSQKSNNQLRCLLPLSFLPPLLKWTRRDTQLLNKHPSLWCLVSTSRWWCNWLHHFDPFLILCVA